MSAQTPRQAWLERKHAEYSQRLSGMGLIGAQNKHSAQQLVNEIEKIEQLMREEGMELQEAANV